MEDSSIAEKNFNVFFEEFGKLSPVERRIMFFLITVIKKNENYDAYRIGMDHFAEMAEINPDTDYEDVVSLIRSIMSRDMLVFNSSNGMDQLVWISCVSHTGDGLEFEFSIKFKEFVFEFFDSFFLNQPEFFI